MGGYRQVTSPTMLFTVPGGHFACSWWTIAGRGEEAVDAHMAISVIALEFDGEHKSLEPEAGIPQARP
jgi:hypothetical protein